MSTSNTTVGHVPFFHPFSPFPQNRCLVPFLFFAPVGSILTRLDVQRFCSLRLGKPLPRCGREDPPSHTIPIQSGTPSRDPKTPRTDGQLVCVFSRKCTSGISCVSGPHAHVEVLFMYSDLAPILAHMWRRAFSGCCMVMTVNI